MNEERNSVQAAPAADVEKQRQGRAGMMDARVFIKGLVALLMVVLALWVVVGAGFLVHELYLALEQGWEKRAEHMVVNVVLLLAVLELLRVLQSYLEIGRVRVTFIIDVTLVVLVGELISLWYREYVIQEVVVSLSVITLLIILRIITYKFSPDFNG